MRLLKRALRLGLWSGCRGLFQDEFEQLAALEEGGGYLVAFVGNELDGDGAGGGFVAVLQEAGVLVVGDEFVGVAVDDEDGDFVAEEALEIVDGVEFLDRKSTRLNSSH